MGNMQESLINIIDVLNKKGFTRYAMDMKGMLPGMSRLFPQSRSVPEEVAPKDPSMPFAKPGERVTELGPSGEETQSLWVKGIDPSSVPKMMQMSDEINKKVERGELSIGKLESQYNEAVQKRDQVNQAVLWFFINNAKKHIRKCASERLAYFGNYLYDKGYDTIASRLKEMSLKLAAKPHEKEHTIPSLEAVHEYMKDYQSYIEKVSKLKHAYTECARIIETFLASFKSEIHRAGKDEKKEQESARKIERLVSDADIKIDRTIRDVERLLPAHPRAR